MHTIIGKGYRLIELKRLFYPTERMTLVLRKSLGHSDIHFDDYTKSFCSENLTFSCREQVVNVEEFYQSRRGKLYLCTDRH